MKRFLSIILMTTVLLTGGQTMAESESNATEEQAKQVIFGFGEENPYGNNWHIHHKGGQILLVTQGRGYYQEWGKPAQELHPGDVVNIPPETKHWHGAAKDSWFTHIAVEVPAKDGSNEWLERVSDEEYNKLK